jgi:glucokinase
MADKLASLKEKETQFNMQRAVVGKATGLGEGTVIDIQSDLEKQGIPADQVAKAIQEKAATAVPPVAKPKV